MQKEIKNIRFGNRKSKVVSFHKGQGQIHEADREKGSSIIANLNAQMRLPKSMGSQNPFQKKKTLNEKMIEWDKKSLFKLGQITKDETQVVEKKVEKVEEKPISQIAESLRKYF
jgi:hypothetical protein